MYKVNDLVVYHRDVCTVIEKKKNDLTGEMCYVLQPFDEKNGSVRMQVPVSYTGESLRDVITKKGVEELMEKIPEVKMLPNKAANMKALYVAKMQGNSLEDLISIIKTAEFRNAERQKKNKKAASVDAEYLSRAEKYLYAELAVALDKPLNDTIEYVESYMH